MQEENAFRVPIGAGRQREEDRDLGFGSVVAGASRQRLLNQDGTFNVQRMGLPFLSSLNLYHTLLSRQKKAVSFNAYGFGFCGLRRVKE